MRIASSDQIEVAVHEFGGHGPPLLLAHATGFHGHCYLPLADRLHERFTSYAVDFRGHGATARPPDWQVDWERYGDDALAAAEAIAPDGGLVAFGHSMGGAALLMAAHRHPGLFDAIVAFEPIVFPTEWSSSSDGPPSDGPSVMVTAARNRRPVFDSYEAAIANYRSKPPMGAFDPDVLRLYVGHGFRPSPEGVRLTCDPEHEARTFEQGAQHRTWELLPDITTRTVVIAGKLDGTGPAAIARPIAERLPNASYLELPSMDHLGPFIAVDRTAELILDVLDHLDDGA